MCRFQPSQWSVKLFHQLTALVGLRSISLRANLAQFQHAMATPLPPNLQTVELKLGSWRVLEVAAL